MIGMMNNKTYLHIAQTTLEMTLAIVAVFLLLAGTARIFLWLTGCLVSRTQATNPAGYNPPVLRVLAEEEGRTDLPATFKQSPPPVEAECHSCQSDINCIEFESEDTHYSCFEGCCIPIKLIPSTDGSFDESP